jgi:hypothetical protein
MHQDRSIRPAEAKGIRKYCPNESWPRFVGYDVQIQIMVRFPEIDVGREKLVLHRE